MGIRASGNIVFVIAYTIKFPKMYSFDTLHKNLAKLHNEPDYTLSFDLVCFLCLVVSALWLLFIHLFICLFIY